ncbi:hypothetical protein, partial [Metamycoplasma hominis]|uniref:hypothetical protein n=1 Tax=Metamycoplasma hominis TaxID=2098 RepID=UPI001CC6146C
ECRQDRVTAGFNRDGGWADTGYPVVVPPGASLPAVCSCPGGWPDERCPWHQCGCHCPWLPWTHRTRLRWCPVTTRAPAKWPGTGQTIVGHWHTVLPSDFAGHKIFQAT